MPKLKTHKGAKARFAVTGTGKIMRKIQGASHLRRNKPARVKRAYHGKVEVAAVDEKRLSRLIPYAGK
ncbi:MAG TPA: 50S ribosomal protein L35 [Dehalococcoidales bacterium]|nr:50S ribosomal protein L35 [Dehalococcoidales bacterium]